MTERLGHAMVSAQPAAAGRISIVVLTYNRCEEVCRTLRGLSALPVAYPVIVVDNGSTDDTAPRIEREFPSVTLVSVGANLGAAGRNQGVVKVATPYVAFCDDDTCWMPGSLEKAVEILDAHPGISVLNARIWVGEDARPDPACVAMASSPLPSVAGVGPELTGFMAGASVMRTHAFRQARGYWAPFFIGGEEALLALDILAQGGTIVYAPAVQLRHWPSISRDTSLRRRLLARNALWTAWLRLPLPLALARSWHQLSFLPDWRTRFAACRDALVGWRCVRRHRRVLDAALCRKLAAVWRDEAGR
ncbi:glycosyltransferase family 2 protein [Bordetella tumulicola]|uniref:glycosyltransferase family 2 protein n=1 Tax=Bordetella tumulicola TaxID=1649133 RepID=UPI0039F128B8